MSKHIGTKTRLAAIALAFVVIANAITVGAGLLGDGGATPLTLDPSVPQRLTATATLTFPSIAASACNEQVIALAGAATGDEVYLGPPPDIDQGFLWGAYVTATDTVTVRLCKITTGTVTPVAHNWRATIVRAGTW